MKIIISHCAPLKIRIACSPTEAQLQALIKSGQLSAEVLGPPHLSRTLQLQELIPECNDPCRLIDELGGVIIKCDKPETCLRIARHVTQRIREITKAAFEYEIEKRASILPLLCK